MFIICADLLLSQQMGPTWNVLYVSLRVFLSSHLLRKKKKEVFLFFVSVLWLQNKSEYARGMVRGGRREEDSGRGTRVYLWQIHVDIWQNQYSIVKLKNKIKFLKKSECDHTDIHK